VQCYRLALTDAPAQRAWDPAGATAGLDPAAQPDADRPAGWASDARAAQGMRPAIVVPQLQPHPPVDKVLSASSAPGTGAKIHRTQSINDTDLPFAIMRQFPE